VTNRYFAIGSFVWNVANIYDSRHYLVQGESFVVVFIVVIKMIIRKCFNFRAIDFYILKNRPETLNAVVGRKFPRVAFLSTGQLRVQLQFVSITV
jgi:hypothetical protein